MFDAQQTDPDVIDAVEAYCGGIYSPLEAHCKSTIVEDPIEIDEVDWDPGEGIWKVVRELGQGTWNFNPTSTDDLMPNQMAAVLRGNTTRPTSFGRKFLMGLVETAATGGDLTSSVLTSLATTLANYLADETVSGTSVLSPGVPRKGVNTFLPFSDGVINSIMGTQRRRKPGIGA